MGTWRCPKPVTGILLAAALLASPESTQGKAVTQPNIILIMLDDLGTEGLRAYDGKIYDTPNIDRLAEEGVRFSRFYVNPICAPTRASLMTGLYPPRTGWTSNRSNKTEGGHCLDPGFGTFVQHLRTAGYSTALAGKWHLCLFGETFDHPAQLGFDKWIVSGHGHWRVKTWVNGAIAPGLKGKKKYIADEHTKFAVRFIRRNAAKPFFLYFPTKLVHKPWDKTPNNLRRKWPKGDPRYFRGMVKYADKMVGRIRRTLKKKRIKKRTIILFLTDNGTEQELPGGGKKTSKESGINVPLIIKWPGTTKSGATRHNLTDVTDLFPTILEMAGLAAEGNRDGFSLVPALTGEGSATGRKWVYAQNEDRFAIRKGNWKLREEQMLFNLEDDPLEENPIPPELDSLTSALSRAELERILIEEGLGPQ